MEVHEKINLKSGAEPALPPTHHLSLRLTFRAYTLHLHAIRLAFLAYILGLHAIRFPFSPYASRSASPPCCCVRSGPYTYVALGIRLLFVSWASWSSAQLPVLLSLWAILCIHRRWGSHLVVEPGCTSTPPFSAPLGFPGSSILRWRTCEGVV